MSNRYWLFLFILAGFWGASFMFTSIGLRSFDYFSLVTLRLSLASITLWVIALLQGWQIPRGKAWFHFFMGGIFMCALPFSLIVWGQQYVESGLAGILNASTAIFGVALTPFFFVDEGFSWNKGMGVLVGFFGIIILIGIGNLAHMSPYNLGQWSIVGATFSYGIGGIYAKKFFKSKPQVNALGMVTSAALLMLAALLIMGRTLDLTASPLGWFSVSYLAIIGTAVAYLLYYYLLTKIGVTYLTLVTLIIPVFAIGLGTMVLGEKLDASDYLGFLLVASGLIIIDGRLFKKRK